MIKKRKNVLVTGASRGIGRGIAFSFASENYDLVVTYSTQKQQAEETADIIKNKYGSKCFVIQASLEKEDIPQKTVEKAIQTLGSIDVLVNNAGVTRFESILDLKFENLNYLINLNFKAYLLSAQRAARHMVENNIKGNVINITSTRGTRAYPKDAVYGGLKAALIRATKSIALDLAPYGIRVNCVAPGATKIRQTQKADQHCKALGKRIPIGRVGMPVDIGNAVVWLASDKASYVTGQNIKVDGGLILPGMPERPTGEKTSWGGDVKKENDYNE